ncbi:M20 family metallo-hydrolase [Sphingobacterium hungaricum]
MNKLDSITEHSISLLQRLIAIPSFSREEDKTADLLAEFLGQHGIPYQRNQNNVWSYNLHFDANKPTILLNSHHDTVKPNKDYTRDPFTPAIENGKLYGLGSNDAGGCLVSLLATFISYYEQENLAYNICFLASAEEEISGKNGIEEAVKHLVPIDFAIIGEPTLLNLAVAEKGLMVLDCEAKGISGHAAREEGENAIYNALEDISWFKSYQFPKESEFLGPVKMSVTMIQAGSQHNVVPANCSFVVDVRTTDVYTNLEVLEIIKQHVKSSVSARSTRLNPSTIPIYHPIVQAGISLGAEVYGSPTMSDQALLSVPSVKVGPGDSARSHSADEFIYVEELFEGVRFYYNLLGKIL